MDLIIFYTLGEKPALTYYINNDNAGYKIEFPFAYIKNITLIENGSGNGNGNGRGSGSGEEDNGPVNRPAGLQVELNRLPNFYMDNSGTGGFYQVGDFTEDHQASQIMIHNLGGDPKVLSGQLAKMVSLDSFINRHTHNPFEGNMNIIAASAPVSPTGPRPQSQPSQFEHPHLLAFNDTQFPMGLHPRGRGHQRTRSRSVPAANDFNMLHSPMPAFHIQHPSTTVSASTIYAPVPQHHSHLTSTGSHLRIDTSTNYGLDMRQYPMSAVTPSPSDYASPAFYPSTSQMDQMQNSNYGGPYGLPFLSPMPDHAGHMIQPSVSPLSVMSHGDPVIANQSPPLSNMHRSASTDFLSMPQDHHANLSDEGLMLSEMYSKQNLNLPMHSPGIEGSDLGMQMHEEPSQDDMDMTEMTAFDTIDPSNINSHSSLFQSS